MRLSQALLSTVLITILIYFTGAIIGQLELAASVFTLVGIVLLVLNSKALLAVSSRRTVADFAYAGALVIPFITLAVLVPQDFRFVNWDEFSHWALSARILITTDALYGPSTPGAFDYYPPGLPVFQYAAFAGGEWSEPWSLRAQNSLILLAWLATASSFSRRPAVVVGLFYAFGILPYLLGFSYTTMYADLPLGALFAAAIATAINVSKRLASPLTFLLIVTVLPLIKEIGILLALVACLVYVVAVGIDRRAQQERSSEELPSWRVVSIAVAGSAFAAFVWQLHLKVGGLGRSSMNLGEWDTSLWVQVVRELSERVTLAQFPVFGAFPAWTKTSMLTIVVTCAAMVVLSATLSRVPDRTRTVVIFSLLLSGLLLYLAALLVLYVYAFSNVEARSLASFERYASTYVIAVVAIAVGLVVQEASSHRLRIENVRMRRVSLITLTSFAILVMLLAVSVMRERIMTVGIIAQPDSLIHLRVAVDELTQEIGRYSPNAGGIHFVQSSSAALPKLMFQYEHPEMFVNTSCSARLTDWESAEPATESGCSMSLWPDSEPGEAVAVLTGSANELRLGEAAGDFQCRVLESGAEICRGGSRHEHRYLVNLRP